MDQPVGGCKGPVPCPRRPDQAMRSGVGRTDPRRPSIRARIKGALGGADELEMPWSLLVLAIPFVVFALVFRRVVGVIQLFQDPDALRGLLSEPVRAAIREAGLDPDTIEMEDLEGREELAQRIAADLKPQLYSRVFGFHRPGAKSGSSSGSSPVGAASTVSMEAWSSGASPAGAVPPMPPSIDAASGMRTSTALVVVAVLVGAGVAALYALGVW